MTPADTIAQGDALTVGDLFAGIGGFRLGLERAGGFDFRWACEIDPYCRAVYAKHWPETMIYGDICELRNPPHVDMLCGGFPCQGLSIAGQRRGLADERSGLFWEFVRLVEQVRPEWFLLENVPGFLSSNRGRDFGIALAALGDCGYGVAWRILDAQYFGLAQRRRRVWIVGCLGRPCPPAILFESQSGSRNSQAGKEAEQEVAGTPGGGSSDRGWCDDDTDRATFIIGQAMSAKWAKGTSGPAGDEHHNLVVAPITSGYAKGAGVNDGKKGSPQNLIVHSLRADGFDASEDGTGRGTPIIVHENINGNIAESETARALRSGASYSYQFVSETPDADGVRTSSGVSRRLDPPDGPRYKALGNAVPVPVVEWIGRRIIEAERRLRQEVIGL